MLRRLSARLAALAEVPYRGLPPKGGAKKGAVAEEPASGKMVVDKAPVNIYKAGQDPQLKPDSEYPDWLWKLLDPQPSLEQLKARPALSMQELRRLVKLERRRLIKEHNDRSKGS